MAKTGKRTRGKMFLSREIAKYTEYLKVRGYTKRTIESYQGGLKVFQCYFKNSELENFTDINRDVVMKYQMYLMNKQPSIALNTQRGYLLCLKHFMRYLVKQGLMLFNPANELELPRRKKSLPRGIMSVKEVKKLLKQPDTKTPLGLRDKTIIEVLYATAIRNQEIRQLKIGDIDLKERTLRVNDGKGRKDRIVPLGKTACICLEEYLKNSRPILCKDIQEQTVFVSYTGKPLDRGNISRVVRVHAKQAQFKKHITPHSLRHSCATHMLKNKASLRHIQTLLGHKSLEATQRYTRIEISDLKRAHQKYHPRERE